MANDSNKHALDVLDEERPITADLPFSEQVERLKELLANPPENSRVVEFSPNLAEWVLSTYNTSNRPMKNAKIKEYAQALRERHWGLTGDTIKFAPDGTLKDGQNRLAAAVRAHVPITSHVVFGVEPELFVRMDIGKNRTASDVFHIAGFQYANHAAATVRWLLIFTSDNPKNRAAHYSNEELLNAYRAQFDPLEIEDSVKMAMDLKKATGAPVAAMAALHYLFSKQDKAKADAFFHQWTVGSEGPRTPTRMLQTRLTEMMVATNNRIHESVRNALVVKAWHAYRMGTNLRKGDLEFDPAVDAFPSLTEAPKPANGNGESEEPKKRRGGRKPKAEAAEKKAA